MGQPVVFTKALAAGNLTAISAAQAVAGAGNVTINGGNATAGVATLDTQRRVVIHSTGNETANTFTVFGTDDNGSPVKASAAGPLANGNATLPIDFLTVSQVTISGASVGNVSVGTNATGSTPFALFNAHLSPPNLSIAMFNTGNVTGSIEYCYLDFFQPIPANGISPPLWLMANSPTPQIYLHPQLGNITQASEGVIDYPIRGWRLTVSAGNGTMTAIGTQAGISGP